MLSDFHLRTRRDFLTTSASGLGGLALAHLLTEDGALGATPGALNPMAPRLTHFAPKAKRCIFIFMAGAPSQMDLFDYKPKLNELDGKKMEPALLEKMRFAFLQKDSAVLMGKRAQLATWKRDFAASDRLVYTRTTEHVTISAVEPIAMEEGRWSGASTEDGRILAAGSYCAKWREVSGSWLIEAEIFVTLA